MTLKASQQGTMKKQLEDILISISWRDLANRYFEKSGSWLYHKLDGIDGNKKPTEFTEEEKYQLMRFNKSFIYRPSSSQDLYPLQD